MFRLVDPHPDFHRSFLEAADEFIAEGREPYAGIVSLASSGDFPGVEFSRAGLERPDEFRRYIDYLLADRFEETPRPRDWVSCTVRWIVEEADYLGRVSLRHQLTDALLTWGGHIGYGVRPSARGRGAATYALSAILSLCRERGIDPALVTCDVDNAASRRTIEHNGGIYEDTRQGKLRFWVPTGHEPRDTPPRQSPS